MDEILMDLRQRYVDGTRYRSMDGRYVGRPFLESNKKVEKNCAGVKRGSSG
jgi:hypothetical protein